MDSLEVDLLVVGFGKAGKTLAATLGRQGRRVALVEQSKAMYGGTCINEVLGTAELVRPGPRSPV